ncbi:MAG: hypothetical protein SXQ77_07985, partial [Halobacteria archaeon]|nr:hypothetical protein [Halobacteria archaeon]
FKDDDEAILSRMESERGLREQECEFIDIFSEHAVGSVERINVEFDINGFEIVESDEEADLDVESKGMKQAQSEAGDGEESEAEEESSGGLLSRFLG